MTFPSFSVGEVLRAQDMNAVGLWKVASGTLSLTTTATNVTGVFSSTYKNYLVLLNITARSTSNRFDMRYIVGTTPTSANYYQGGIASDYASNTTLYFQRSNNDNQLYFDTTTNVASYRLDIFQPNDATVATRHHGQHASVGTGYSFAFGGVQTALTAFTGFQLFTSTGTMTVEYQVFGYQN
jgi:hypothetical protein